MTTTKSTPDKFGKLEIIPFKIKHEYERTSGYSPICKHCDKCDHYDHDIYHNVYYREQDTINEDTGEIYRYHIYYCESCVKDNPIGYIHSYETLIGFGRRTLQCGKCHININESLKNLLTDTFESLHEYNCQEIHTMIKQD